MSDPYANIKSDPYASIKSDPYALKVDSYAAPTVTSNSTLNSSMDPYAADPYAVYSNPVNVSPPIAVNTVGVSPPTHSTVTVDHSHPHHSSNPSVSTAASAAVPPIAATNSSDSAVKPLVAHYDGSLAFGRPPPGHQNDPTMGHIYHGRRVGPPPPGNPVPPSGPEHKIFIGGLSRTCTTAQLREYFSQFGVLTDVAVICHRTTGEPRGFGFATFQTLEAKNACLSSKLELDGRVLECKPALPADECIQTSPVAVEPSRGFENKIFVGGVAQTVTQDMVRDYFSQYGTVTDCILMHPKEGSLNNHRGFGFIKFAEKSAFQMVLDKHQEHVIEGKWVEVKPAVSKDAPDSYYQSMNSKPPKRIGFENDDIMPQGGYNNPRSGGYSAGGYQSNAGYGSKPYGGNPPTSYGPPRTQQPPQDDFWWDTAAPPAAPPAYGTSMPPPAQHHAPPPHSPYSTDAYTTAYAPPAAASYHHPPASYYPPTHAHAHPVPHAPPRDPYGMPAPSGDVYGAPAGYAPPSDPYYMQGRERERDRPYTQGTNAPKSSYASSRY